MRKDSSGMKHVHIGGAFAARARLARAAVAVVSLASAALTPRLASAAACVSIDEERDGLSAEERQSTRTLFEEALGEAGVSVAREGCNEAWTLYHIKLGTSLTVVVQGPQGTRRERVKTLEDLPATYHQLAHSLVNGGESTNDGSAIDRRNVTESQEEARRVIADAIWYAKLGFGSTPAAGLHAGPAFGFGRRWELDRVGINLGFLNFIMYQDSDEFKGVSAGWIDLGADYFFDAYANSTPFVGAGLSLGNHSLPDARGGNYENAGLQGKASAGYEMFRASTIRLSAQVDATLPMYRLVRTSVDPATQTESSAHVYSPTFQLSLGLGWGGSS